ncbi:4-amino-4-deoxychorismate lyase [Azomonas agilis]|uniref:Aminodeoxychorismate lyase n=1 Tax=Azomonas agilis TaxID=116849 RepID=A0A562J112_9GAMM|nr:aminodeoxychorismate lyase [Azomonas agilis]TWH76514.1 4-amino-4-deoxychorismate lyase [Azomonas agilis]
MSLVWLNGVPATEIACDDRGLAYGDGLFETLRVQNGQIPLLERHLQRLELGCQRLMMPTHKAQWQADVLAFAAELGTGVCKLLLTRGSGLRGYSLPDPCQPRCLLLGSELPKYPVERSTQGIALFPCATRLAEQPLLAGLKHLNRLEQVLARSEWQDPQYAEGLMRDTSGRVIEGVFSNLFMVQAGQLVTPVLSRCGVAGVMRAELLAAASSLNIPCVVRDLAYVELLKADEVFMCNSIYGIWPVNRLQDSSWPQGPVTRRLQEHLSLLWSTSSNAA